MLTPLTEHTDNTVPDYYALLGVAQDAPLEAIQQPLPLLGDGAPPGSLRLGSLS
jgi:hypothetical protein